MAKRTFGHFRSLLCLTHCFHIVIVGKAKIPFKLTQLGLGLTASDETQLVLLGHVGSVKAPITRNKEVRKFIKADLAVMILKPEAALSSSIQSALYDPSFIASLLLYISLSVAPSL